MRDAAILPRRQWGLKLVAEAYGIDNNLPNSTASLQNPVPPSLVGQRILEIVESGTWQLRHPVGPDAELNASDDETWYRNLEHDFGLDARPKN